MSSNQKFIVQISDTHVWSSERNAAAAAARGNKRGGMGTWQRLAETEHICKAIAARFDPKDTVVLVTGDIVEGGNVDRTRQMEYRNAATALQPIARKGFDIHLAPGNHDYGPFGNFFSPDARRRYLDLHQRICKYRTTFPHAQDYGSWRLFLLDSVAHKGRAAAFARGKLGSAQLSWLRASLPSNAKPTVIAFHHHPVMRRIGSRTFLAIEDSDEFWSVLYSFPDIPITVCCGHKHVEDLRLVRSGKLRAVAAGQCTQDFGGIIVDPFQKDARRVDLRHIAAPEERTLASPAQVRNRWQGSRQDLVLYNRLSMEKGCVIKSVNLVRVNSKNEIISGPARKITVAPREIAGAYIREDSVGTNKPRVVVRTWNGSANHLRFQVVYTVLSTQGADCRL